MDMEAKDLRIGNLVIDPDGDVSQITGINKEHSIEVCNYYLDNSYSGAIEDIKPILLTSNWLKKLGWLYNKRTLSFENGDTRMHLEYRKLNGSYTMFNYVLKAKIAERIWHVHQLQNLYHALTGQELIIKDK